jgi:serine protease Do
MTRTTKLEILVGGLMAAGAVVAALGNYERLYASPIAQSHATAALAMPAGQPAMPAAALPDFTGIVARNGPAVVNISVTGSADGGRDFPAPRNLDPDSPFYQFFHQFEFPGPRAQVPTHATGSGFIVDSHGIILTNAHVVDGAKDVTVKLTDKREFNAKVVGADKASDVAVLRIDARNLPTVKLDSADDVKVGQWVVAIGSPYGFENSATAGIVSANARALGDGSYVPFIQTDVAVNPGNSGGPLFNANGEVVGINSQIYTSTGGYEGISFAIPIKVALNVKEQLAAHGRVSHGQLGVTIQDVNQGLADSFGLKSPMGALVSSVRKDSPAAKAGLQPGDVILRFNDQDIMNSVQLPMLVADTPPGTRARLDVMRKGETRHMDITVGKMENVAMASSGDGGQDHGRLGMAVRPLTSDEREQAGASGGVIVEDATGPAAEAGIRAGDVILSLNGTPVKSPERLQQLAAQAGKHVALLVQRGDSKVFVPVDLG